MSKFGAYNDYPKESLPAAEAALLTAWRTLGRYHDAIVLVEPATAQEFSINPCLHAAENCFARGLPAIVSVHSINFHSTIKDFRSPTLRLLDQFLSALEAKHPDLLYVNDEDLYDLVDKGRFQSMQSAVRVPVTKRKFSASAAATGWRA